MQIYDTAECVQNRLYSHWDNENARNCLYIAIHSVDDNVCVCYRSPERWAMIFSSVLSALSCAISDELYMLSVDTMFSPIFNHRTARHCFPANHSNRSWHEKGVYVYIDGL